MSATNYISELGEENTATETLVNLFGRTDVGKAREHNEDNFVICQNVQGNDWEFDEHALKLGKLGCVMVVADGMGGANAGEVASEIMVTTAKSMFQQITTLPESSKGVKDFLIKVLNTAHQNILEHAKKDSQTEGMGTTGVLAWVIGNKAYVAWAGDSRVYLHRAGKQLRPATDDHSMVWQLVLNGHLTPEEARVHPQSNIITQSLGDPNNGPKPDTKTLALQAGDRLMLCSDGLNGMLDDIELEGILNQHQDTATTCQELVNQANLAGGGDNITVLLMDVLETSSNTESTYRDTADQTGGKTTMKKGILWGVSLVILFFSIFLLTQSISNSSSKPNAADSALVGGGKALNSEKLRQIWQNFQKQKEKDQDTTSKKTDSTRSQGDGRQRNNITDESAPPTERVDQSLIKALEAQLSQLLNEKAGVKKKIQQLKIKYKDVPGDLAKLKALEQRLTDEIASPLLSNKVIEGANQLRVPKTMREYEKAKNTIERVEANLVIIQEKMRYWALNPSNG
ncbi:hypothetical protein BKI52_22115 [marine bacterium AO1-C]|nr:hypothetical protein BKI52_22115 [marine bacterium AO1-C]